MFKDKNVLVTGGTRGIGKAIVEAFSKEGANVAFTFRSSEESARKIAHALGGGSSKIAYYMGDAADAETANNVVKSVIDDWGSIDVLVNNAGITRDNLMLRMSEEDWDAVITTNLKSVFNYCKAAYRQLMKQRAGKVINIASVVGVTGNPGQTNYAASKAGIIGFSKSLAKELGSRGVTVNVVAPGYVDTDMTADLNDAAKETMLGAIPLKRTATTDDIAAAVLFLASSGADYITGQVLSVDGGLAM